MGIDEKSILSHPETQSLSTHNWWNLFRLLQANHVAALTADTIAQLEVPREVKIPWLAERDKAVRWHRYQEEIQQEILDCMKEAGIETMVLKGTRLSQYYHKPELREFGDLDLYFYDRHDEADEAARRKLKVEVSDQAHHHSKYNYRGVTVESHYDLLNTHYPPSNRRYEKLLKEFVPSPTFEILFLLRHMACHFAASRITLRDVVDWFLACKALHGQVDWTTVQNTAEQYGMKSFMSALDDIVEQRFGSQPPTNATTQSLVEHDIVYGSNVADLKADGFERLLWKPRRWRAMAWKRRMVFSDHECTLLLASLTSHAMKPQSILHKM